MTTTRRLQQRYDHRLRDLVRGTGDVTIATDLGVPRSTARGWLGKAPKVVVSPDVTNLNASELQQEVLELRRRVQKLTALLRLALVLLRTSGFTLTYERLPDGRAKIRILRAVDRARAFVPLRCCCGSCDCPRVGSTPGDGCSPRVRWTISRPVRTRRPID
jgi:putative transposase